MSYSGDLYSYFKALPKLKASLNGGPRTFILASCNPNLDTACVRQIASLLASDVTTIEASYEDYGYYYQEIHDLMQRLEHAIFESPERVVHVSIQDFLYKYGLVVDDRWTHYYDKFGRNLFLDTQLKNSLSACLKKHHRGSTDKIVFWSCTPSFIYYNIHEAFKGPYYDGIVFNPLDEKQKLEEAMNFWSNKKYSDLALNMTKHFANDNSEAECFAAADLSTLQSTPLKDLTMSECSLLLENKKLNSEALIDHILESKDRHQLYSNCLETLDLTPITFKKLLEQELYWCNRLFWFLRKRFLGWNSKQLYPLLVENVLFSHPKEGNWDERAFLLYVVDQDIYRERSNKAHLEQWLDTLLAEDTLINFEKSGSELLPRKFDSKELMNRAEYVCSQIDESQRFSWYNKKYFEWVLGKSRFVYNEELADSW